MLKALGKRKAKENFTEGLSKDYKQELQRHLAKRLRYSSLEPDDVIQEAFLRLIRMEKTDFIENPRAYLYKVTFNVIHELEMKHSREHDQVGLNVIDDATTETTGIDRIEHLSSLEALLHELPKKQYRVLMAIKYDGKTYEETAKELNLTLQTVRRYIFLAIQHCRDNGWL